MRGFTVIELVTTIIIIGILGALAVPYFPNNLAFSQRGYVDEVASTLRYAQKIAIASGCDVSVAITAAGYAVTQQSAAGNSCDTAGAWTTPVRRTDGSTLANSAPAGVVLAPDTTIVFKPDGSTAADAPLLSIGTFTLTIARVGGLVTVAP